MTNLRNLVSPQKECYTTNGVLYQGMYALRYTVRRVQEARASWPRSLVLRTLHMQSDPTVGTRVFPSRDGGFRSPASVVGVQKTPIARRASQRPITQTVAVETLARSVVPPVVKASSVQQQQQQHQQRQDKMQKSSATVNITAAARAAADNAGGVMAKTVVINSSSIGKKNIAAEDVAVVNSRTNSTRTAVKGITSYQSTPNASPAVAKGATATGMRRGIGQVRGVKVDREVR